MTYGDIGKQDELFLSVDFSLQTHPFKDERGIVKLDKLFLLLLIFLFLICALSLTKLSSYHPIAKGKLILATCGE